MSLLDSAVAYLDAGLCALPAILSEKRPALASWRRYQKEHPTPEELRRIWSGADALCLITGAVSGNAHLLDFDHRGELFPAWRDLVESEMPGLVGRLVLERSQGGGMHASYRCQAPVGGNHKLATRTLSVAGKDPVTIQGKEYVPRESKRGWEVTLTLIETRGEGGLFLCAPSPGYELVQGRFEELPVLTAEEHGLLLDAARALNEAAEEVEQHFPEAPAGRPGDDYNDRGPVADLLEKHGWTQVSGGENERWRRPGKEKGWSGTLKDRVFYCFTSNAAPLTEDTAYGPFQLYAALEHGGDFTQAATELRRQGYGGEEPAGPQPDISGLLPQTQDELRAEIALPPTLNEVIIRHPDLCKPIVHNLLREGETMNLISAPKIGKTWLAYALSLATVSGESWLGEFPCAQGPALLVDNELHPETAAHRIPNVARAMGLNLAEVGDLLRIESCRGRLMDLHELGRRLVAYGPNTFKLVVLDAFYRFLPAGTDENDNGAMARLYNLVDRLAKALCCAFVLVHHTSKGLQGHKNVTDVGAGAGAQSRAADTHVILRRHEEPNVAVFDAAARSWPPIDSFCLRWDYPIWTPARELDPANLESPYSRRRSKRDPEPSEPAEPSWTPERFAESFLKSDPQAKEPILMAANDAGVSDHMAERLLRRALYKGLAYRWKLGGNASAFATEPQPELPLGEDPDASKADQVMRLLQHHPDMSHRAIAKQCGTYHSYVSRLAKRLEKGSGA